MIRFRYKITSYEDISYFDLTAITLEGAIAEMLAKLKRMAILSTDFISLGYRNEEDGVDPRAIITTTIGCIRNGQWAASPAGLAIYFRDVAELARKAVESESAETSS